MNSLVIILIASVFGFHSLVSSGTSSKTISNEKLFGAGKNTEKEAA